MGDGFREKVFFSISLDFKEYELYRVSHYQKIVNYVNLKQQKAWARDKIV